MFNTYQAGTNTATNGTVLDAGGQDVFVHQIIIGLPVAGGTIALYNINNPLGSSSANLAFKVVLPTFSATNPNPGVYSIEFPKGLPLGQGGNLQIDNTMNVTVVWSLASEKQ